VVDSNARARIEEAASELGDILRGRGARVSKIERERERDQMMGGFPCLIFVNKQVFLSPFPSLLSSPLSLLLVLLFSPIFRSDGLGFRV
jgi:hypothetical protein